MFITVTFFRKREGGSVGFSIVFCEKQRDNLQQPIKNTVYDCDVWDWAPALRVKGKMFWACYVMLWGIKCGSRDSKSPLLTPSRGARP